MSKQTKNIVLVGRTGNGKSATGNSLLGRVNMFESKNLAVGVTRTCEMFRAAIQDGPIINVIDTPGLCDSAILLEDLSKEITNCLTMTEEGIHAVLLVLSVKNRISQEEESTINILQSIFDSKILDYFIVVFTGGDELEVNNETLDDFFSAGCPEVLEKILRLCDGRKVVFNNRTKDKKTKTDQLKQLLAHVADIGEKTGGIPYTYQMHSKIKEETEKHREQERAAEAKNLAEAELVAGLEKIRKEQEIIAIAEENGRLKEQERTIEANNLAEAKHARVMDELRMEHEKNMQMTEENEKRREQERAMESKNLAETMRQDKIRMDQKMIALADKNQKEQEKAIEANNLAVEAKLAIAKEELQMEHKKNMQIMAEENEKRREQERAIESKKLAETMRQEKIRMDQEMIALSKRNDEKLREQKRIIESKNRVEAEQALMHEKLRMDQEKIALVEAGKNRIEQQKAIESKNRAEAELVARQEKLRMENEKLKVEKEKFKQLIAQEEEKRLKEKQMNESKKIRVVYARDLSISWSENISYWSWLPLPYETSSGSLVEAAVLKEVCFLSVNGKFDTIELTPATTYEVVYVVKLEDPTSGWETPVNLKLTLPDSRARPQEHSVSLKEHIGKQWVDIPAGEFMMSAENTGEISFSLYEIETGSWKRGLFVKGVEIRPKK